MKTDLAYARNILKRGDFNSDVQKIINNAIRVVRNTKSPFSEICLEACFNAISDIERKDYISAGYEINLIHNMPVFEKFSNIWDEKHFYLIEFSVYLDNAESYERVKRMITIIARLVGNNRL